MLTKEEARKIFSQVENQLNEDLKKYPAEFRKAVKNLYWTYLTMPDNATLCSSYTYPHPAFEGIRKMPSS